MQSRYYDPEIGRFINADALVSTGQGILGNNMFAYCLNNSINYVDHTGTIGRTTIFPVCWEGPIRTDPIKLGPYDSADEAARAFSEYIYSSSLYIRHEYSTIIYAKTENGVTRYYFTYPTAGEPHRVNIGQTVPRGSIMVAYAHTHPNGNEFSDKDITIAIRYNCDAYVVGPNLNLQKLCVTSAKIVSLEPITPRSLSTSEKTILKLQFYESWMRHIDAGCDGGCANMYWPTTR